MKDAVFPQYSITLRDWFAGLALNGMLSNETYRFAAGEAAEQHNLSIDQFISANCYQIADAMMKAREEK